MERTQLVSTSAQEGNIPSRFPPVSRNGTYPAGFHQCAGREYTQQVSTGEEDAIYPMGYTSIHEGEMYPAVCWQCPIHAAGFHQCAIYAAG